MEYTTTTTTAGMVKKCRHLNGWFQKIPWAIIFYRYVFICTDCWKILDADRTKEIRPL
jgi:hypothetical protein